MIKNITRMYSILGSFILICQLLLFRSAYKRMVFDEQSLADRIDMCYLCIYCQSCRTKTNGQSQTYGT